MGREISATDNRPKEKNFPRLPTVRPVRTLMGMSVSELAGTFVGNLIGPLTALGAKARHKTRLFHPVGVVLRARVVGLHSDGHLAPAARAVEGSALVRLSTAWWKKREWIDALGCAIRFRRSDAVTPEPEPGDQDLLFATIRFPVTTLLAPLTTEQHHFGANYYFAVSPFDVPGLGRAKLRLAPIDGFEAELEGGLSREDRLRRAVAHGIAAFRLEARRRSPARAMWEPFAELRLEEEVSLDQQALKFWPFRTGRGFVPRGFIHSLRIGTYEGSQTARTH